MPETTAEPEAAPAKVTISTAGPNGFFTVQQEMDIDAAEQVNTSYDKQLSALRKCMEGK